MDQVHGEAGRQFPRAAGERLPDELRRHQVRHTFSERGSTRSILYKGHHENETSTVP